MKPAFSVMRKDVVQAQNIKKEKKKSKICKARFTLLDHLLIWKENVLW